MWVNKCNGDFSTTIGDSTDNPVNRDITSAVPGSLKLTSDPCRFGLAGPSAAINAAFFLVFIHQVIQLL